MTVTGQQWDTGGELSQRTVTRKPPNTSQQLFTAWVRTSGQRNSWGHEFVLMWPQTSSSLWAFLRQRWCPAPAVTPDQINTLPRGGKGPPLPHWPGSVQIPVGLWGKAWTSWCKWQWTWPICKNDSSLTLFFYCSGDRDEKDSGAPEVAQW